MDNTKCKYIYRAIYSIFHCLLYLTVVMKTGRCTELVNISKVLQVWKKHNYLIRSYCLSMDDCNEVHSDGVDR